MYKRLIHTPFGSSDLLRHVSRALLGDICSRWQVSCATKSPELCAAPCISGCVDFH